MYANDNRSSDSANKCPSLNDSDTTTPNGYRTPSPAPLPKDTTMSTAPRPLSSNTKRSFHIRNTSSVSSIMHRGRPLRKSSNACWPGTGRELGAQPAEEWKRENRPVAGISMMHSYYSLYLRHL
jgi:hypothetical protein